MSVFKNEYTRVSKIDEPLLIIGLGGSGLDGLLHIKDLFSKRMEMEQDAQGNKLNHPPRTAYLEIDTDGTALQKSYNGTELEASEFIDLSNTNMAAMLGAPGTFLESYQREWLDTLYQKTFLDGAGGIRQAGRLLFMLKAQKVYDTLKGLITNLVSVAAGAAAPANRITIIVIAGLSGGTGSGTFLDVPYLIRAVMRDWFNAYHYDISGYLVMPDVHVEVAAKGDATKQKRYESNGFAALKELDYWMGSDSHKHPFVQQYTENVKVDWSQSHPYDDVTLLSARLANGVIIKDPAEVIYNLLAENMLNYMSYEPTLAGTAALGFTYKQHKSNVITDILKMSKPYPANYCYTAIGAASTNPQQDQMIDYEASLLIEKMVDLAKNQPDPNSMEARNFADSVLALNGAYERAKRSVPLHEWEVNKPTHAFGDEIRNGGSGYHGMNDGGVQYDWEHGVVRPQMQAFFFGDPNDANMHGELRDIWVRFVDAAKDIILNHKNGPYYLETLLDGDKGVIKQVERKLSEARGEMGTCEAEITRCHTSAENEYGNVRNANIPEKVLENLHIESTACGRYVDACVSLYENTRKKNYCEQLIAALTTLKDWMQGYLDNSLRVYNQTMTELNENLGNTVGTAGTAATAVVSFGALKGTIDTRFNSVNQNDEMLSKVLNMIAERSLTYVGGDDARPAERRRFEKDIEHFVNETFKDMNAADLDAALEMAGGTDSATRVSAVVNGWAPRLNAAATPMFDSLAGMGNDPFVPFAYVSVPNNADDFRKGINQYTTNNSISVTLKDSMVLERVMWLNTHNGLPLCRYAGLAKMEASYEGTVNQPSGAGIHLIGGQAMMKWKDLPSPIPHELLNIGMSPRVQKEHNEAMDVLNRAIDAGMLTISGINPTYKLRFLTVNGAEPSSDDFANMLSELQIGDTDKTNAADINYWAQKPAAIAALIASGTLSQQTVTGDYKKFAGIHGFVQRDYDHQPGETQERRKVVDDNIALLNKDLVLYTLSKRPYTIARIKKQMDFFGQLNAYQEACAAKQTALQDQANAAAAQQQAQAARRNAVVNYSQDVANMMMLEIITFVPFFNYIAKDDQYWPTEHTIYSTQNADLDKRRECPEVLLVEHLNDQPTDIGDRYILDLILKNRMTAIQADQTQWPQLNAVCMKLMNEWQRRVNTLNASVAFSVEDRKWFISVYQKMINTVAAIQSVIAPNG